MSKDFDTARDEWIKKHIAIPMDPIPLDEMITYDLKMAWDACRQYFSEQSGVEFDAEKFLEENFEWWWARVEAYRRPPITNALDKQFEKLAPIIGALKSKCEIWEKASTDNCERAYALRADNERLVKQRDLQIKTDHAYIEKLREEITFEKERGDHNFEQGEILKAELAKRDAEIKQWKEN